MNVNFMKNDQNNEGLSKNFAVLITENTYNIDGLIEFNHHRKLLINPASGAKVRLPDSNFSLASLPVLDLDAWGDVIDQILSISGGVEKMVIEINHPLRELVLIGAAMEKAKYSIVLSQCPERLTAVDYALFSGTQRIFWKDEKSRNAFDRLYIGPSKFAPMKDIIKELQDGVLYSSTNKLSSPLSGNQASVRVLLLAYFSGPCSAVGVQRVNYWANNLKRLSGGVFDVHVATSIDWDCETATVHFIPDTYIASLLDSSCKLETWARSFIENDTQDSKFYDTLSSFWRVSVEKYFENLEISFDVVIITGNPFPPFDFAAFAKRNWHSRVFLDYRDPFANNPRMIRSSKVREYIRDLERAINFQADGCISVNYDCLNYLEGGDEAVKIIIPNGYDERSIANVKSSSLDQDFVNFVHSGSFYYDRSPSSVLTSLDVTAHRFHHVGNPSGVDNEFLECEALVLYGRKSYADTMSVVAASDCGIVFVTETGFETPTKLYDYLAFGLDILICTHGPIRGGALAQELKDYPRVFWCENSPQGVAEFLSRYTPNRAKHVDTTEFSRETSTLRLVDEIRKSLP